MAIHSLVVEITNADGSMLRPVYECHGEDKFAEFVAWHEANLAPEQRATLSGFDYNKETPDVIRFINHK